MPYTRDFAGGRFWQFWKDRPCPSCGRTKKWVAEDTGICRDCDKKTETEKQKQEEKQCP